MPKQGLSLLLVVIIVTLQSACAPVSSSALTVQLLTKTAMPALFAPVPTVYTVDGKEFEDAEAATIRDHACTTLNPIDLKQVIQNSLPDQPIAWRLNLNFKEQDKAGNPLGCFRLFEVIPGDNSAPPTIQAIDGGGFLINTCVVKGDVTIDPNHAQATFANQGFIHCAVNIRAWVAALKDHLSNVNNQKAVAFMSQQTAQSYSNLVMYGRGAPSPSGNPWQGYLLAPLGYYQPLVDPKAYPPLAMSLFADKSSSWASLYGLLNNTAYRIPTSAGNGCIFENLKGRHDWWLDFRSSDSALRFSWRDLNSNNPEPHLCQALQPSLPAGQLLNFWIDEAALTIGYTPPTSYSAPQPGADPAQWYSGILEEFVLDPTDSKPPA